jgi:YD repeat-containing protein
MLGFYRACERNARIKAPAPLLAALCLVLLTSLNASAQDVGAPVNAKAYDTVSPTGVSYHSGSFIYILPLFEIGQGEYPDSLNIALQYDSSDQVSTTTGWSLQGGVNASGMLTSANVDTYEINGDIEVYYLLDQWQYGAFFSFGKLSKSFEVRNADFSVKDFQAVTNSGDALDYDAVSHIFKYTSRTGQTLSAEGFLNYAYNLEFGPNITLKATNGLMVHYSGMYRDDMASPSRWSNSRGLVVVKEVANFSQNPITQRICAYNLATIDVGSTYNCNSSNLVSILKYARGDNYALNLKEVTLPRGAVYKFDYTKIVAVRGYAAMNGSGDQFKTPKQRYRLTCVRGPDGACLVTNTYDACDGYSGQGYSNQGVQDPGWTGSRDRVITQVLRDGTSVSYGYPGQTTPCRDVTAVDMTRGGAVTHVALQVQDNWPLNVGFVGRNFPFITSVTDPIGRITKYKWTGKNGAAPFLGRDDLLAEVEYPEGNKAKLSYDSRGNILESRLVAKPGASVADIVSARTFPSTCTNSLTCNLPLTSVDPLGATTSYTFSPDHGGILTSVGPPVGGVSPATKYYYAQRYAWLKNGAAYSAAAEPIWLLTEERSCRTSSLNLSSGDCAAGASDLVKRVYEYGPDSGPNNLWLRGVAVTADGTTLRTCYAYDSQGNKISETRPRGTASLSVCP